MAVLYTFIVVLMCMFVKGNEGRKIKKSVQKCTDSVELVTGVEPATCGLRYRCSAIEPHQRETILPQTVLFVNRKNQGIAFYLKV